MARTMAIKQRSNPKLIAEWEACQSLFLVYPEGLEKRNELIPFYNKFISILPQEIKLNLLVKNSQIEKRLRNTLHVLNYKNEINYIISENIRDIWIRDWAPIILIDSNRNKIAIKAKYSPRYLYTLKNKKDAKADNDAGIELAALLNIPIVDLPIILDLGNFTHNGKGIAIVTNRIISDNEELSIDEIRCLFKDKLGIDRLIFVPVEPGDETGHVDGIIRFISENTICLASYPEEYKEGYDFLNKVEEQIKRELGNEFKIIRLPNSLPQMKSCENISSAFGNHVNYILYNNHLLLPSYGIIEDDMSEKILIKNFPSLNIHKINIPEIKILSQFGGVLNCISWTYFHN